MYVATGLNVSTLSLLLVDHSPATTYQKAFSIARPELGRALYNPDMPQGNKIEIGDVGLIDTGRHISVSCLQMIISFGMLGLLEKGVFIFLFNATQVKEQENLNNSGVPTDDRPISKSKFDFNFKSKANLRPPHKALRLATNTIITSREPKGKHYTKHIKEVQVESAIAGRAL